MAYLIRSDLLATSLVFLYVGFWLVLTEYLARSSRMSKEDSRKVLHIMVGNVAFILPMFKTYLIAVMVPAFFILGNFFMTPYSPISKLRLKTFEAGHAMGTVYYAISLTALTLFFFETPEVIVISFMPVAYGDGLAAAVGMRSTKYKFRAVGGEKSLQGSIAMFLASWGSVNLSAILFSLPIPFITSLLIATGTTLIEILSPKGTDNLLIPLSVSILFYPFVVLPTVSLLA